MCDMKRNRCQENLNAVFYFSHKKWQNQNGLMYYFVNQAGRKTNKTISLASYT